MTPPAVYRHIQVQHHRGDRGFNLRFLEVIWRLHHMATL